MQYALITAGDHRRLIDASELGMLRSRKPVADLQPQNQDKLVWRIVYGAYMIQHGCAPDDSVNELKHNLGTAFGLMDTVKQICRLSLVRDIELYPMVKRGSVSYHPMSALIWTDQKIPELSKFALSFFPRLKGMDALHNVLNRKGILAIKGQEAQAVKILNPTPDGVAWRQFADQARAERTAATCR